MSALLLLASMASAGQLSDFVGQYDLVNWSVTPISGGTSDVDLVASTTTDGVFTYYVNLGGGGVTARQAVFEVVADETGTASFDVEIDCNHAWFQAYSTFDYFWVDSGGSTNWINLVDQSTSGQTVINTSVNAFPIEAGQPFGFAVGGENYDSNSFLDGTVTVTNFEATATDDCNGIPAGPNVLDNCGTCDADPGNDCVQDCAGTWGGTATFDMCGTCDDNPANDCVQDCLGSWGGSATLDNCGTCDANPANDCVRDCAGTWGGSATVDMCGTCDDNVFNDCVQDCNGVWGGSATLDYCGVCDDDPTNDCDLDCYGIPNGPATLDNCGVCDADPTNDCVQDCNGEWGGLAVEDNCGTCDDDPTNDCTDDCNGVPDGPAVEDNCGTCDDDPTNDCEQDCNGEWGGTAAIDVCGVCSGGSTGIPVDDCPGLDSSRDWEPVPDGQTAEPVDVGCGCDSVSGSPAIGGLALIMLGLVRRRSR